MKRELGIARCGLACCLCSENATCKGCKRDGFMELSWCKDAEWCEVRRCGINKNLHGCYDCLERNEQAGIVYHREGIMGDYDDFDDLEELISYIRTGKR